MKWVLVIVVVILIKTVASKDPEKKISTKKPSNIKPTKSGKTILEQFRGLPSDDVDFIKQLDKQFEAHGNQLKIKVVQENTTTNKNGKRNIDGNLGYGYQDNQLSQGYYFSKPKWQIYPYSQQDIPPVSTYNSNNNHHHQQHSSTNQQQYTYSTQMVNNYQQHKQYLPPATPSQQYTSVEISPSRGYEIKETSNEYEGYNNYPSQQQYQTEAPVIILRVPGPPKYAAHLQALLQQYLEIRAAQYIKLLQQHESAKYSSFVPIKPQTQYSYPEQGYVYQNPYASHSQSYSDEDGTQTQYQGHAGEQYYQDETEQPQYAAYSNEQQLSSAEEKDQSYQSYSTMYHRQSASPQIYQRPQYIYSKPIAITEPTHLPTSENYPRSSHTQVYFPNSLKSRQSESSSPAIFHPQTFHPPLVYEQHQEYDYNHSDQEYGPSSERNNIVSITQRTTPPYNYHAHSTSMPLKGAKRQTTLTEEQLQKFSKLVSRLKEKSLKETKNESKS